jgi:hypothetical protein
MLCYFISHVNRTGSRRHMNCLCVFSNSLLCYPDGGPICESKHVTHAVTFNTILNDIHKLCFDGTKPYSMFLYTQRDGHPET